jgi:hypothetical protein
MPLLPEVAVDEPSGAGFERWRPRAGVSPATAPVAAMAAAPAFLAALAPVGANVALPSRRSVRVSGEANQREKFASEAAPKYMISSRFQTLSPHKRIKAKIRPTRESI